MVRNAITILTLLLSTALSATMSSAGTYTICTGELVDSAHCPPAMPHAGCPPPDGQEKSLAAQLCQQEGSNGTPVIVHLNTLQGQRCGYNFFQVTCQ